MSTMFRAIYVEKTDGKYSATLKELDESALPAGDTVVNVAYSTLNYKDALAITGKSPILRTLPCVPGIDLAGTVVGTNELVVLNGWGIGENTWGGLSQKARVSKDWLVPIPASLDAHKAMVIGTAGFTAMLSIMALEKHGVTPDKGPVLVTGANGGVGSFAVAFLAALGFSVTASTGRVNESDYLKKLGASEIIDRKELSEPGKPLGKERWAAAIDSVGSHTLANICASTKWFGAVAACGLAQGMDFPATVAPFILRGVSLLGINSVMQPREARIEAWRRMAALAKPEWFTDIGQDVPLTKAIEVASDVLAGKIRGRLVVDVNA